MTNEELLKKYPWLLPRNRWTDEPIKDYDYSWTELDAMPDGWRNAFGEQMCEEIQQVLEKANYVDKYRILQIKEKWGFLHWYHGGVPKEICDELATIIRKYEKISERTCFICGKPATKISMGWICPWCDDCAEKNDYEQYILIDEWFKKQESPFADGATLHWISIEPR